MTASEIISIVKKEKRQILFEDESQAIMKNYGIPVPPTSMAVSEDNAVNSANVLGYPVVLKISSPLISHKTEAGGVKLSIPDEAALRTAYRELMSGPGKRDENARVIVQPMVNPGIEVIIGYIKDNQFGPVVIFGLGGILVEVLRDVAFRMAPLDLEEAGRMIMQTRASKLLNGFRGSPPVDMEQLKKIIVSVARLGYENPDIAEMDLNPVMARPDGTLVLDARVSLS